MLDHCFDNMPFPCISFQVVYDLYASPCDFIVGNVNIAFEKIYGLPAEYLIGKCVSETMPEVLKPEYNRKKIYSDIAINCGSAIYNEYFEAKDEWYRVYAFSKEKNYVTVVFFEITDFIQASEKWSSLDEYIDDVIVEIDADFNIVSVIASDDSTLYIDKAKMINKGINDIYPEHFSTKLISSAKKAMAEKTKQIFYYRSLILDENKWYKAVVNYIRSNKNYKFVFTRRDITEQKRLEQELFFSDELFKTVFDQVPVGIAFGNNNNLILECNKTLESIVGRTREQLLSYTMADVSFPELPYAEIEKYRLLEKGDIGSVNFVKCYKKDDGNEVWVNISSKPLKLGNNKQFNHLSVIQDVTDYVSSVKALKESERSKEVLLHNLPGLAYRCKYDRDWTMEFVSQGCYQLTGYKSESFINNRDIKFNDIIMPEYRNHVWQTLAEAVENHTQFDIQYEIITATGDIKCVFDRGQAVYTTDGEVEALEGIILDITDKKRKDDEILYINNHDLLTGLYNRRFFEEQKKYFDNEEYLPLSIIIGNINGLRLVNDAYGHNKGDKLINNTSKILMKYCPDGCILARTGGDEFSLLMPNTSFDTAFDLLKKIKQECENYNISVLKRNYNISISLGVDTKTTVNEDIASVIKKAEEYMYKRKLFEHKSSHSYILSSIKTTLYEKSQETEKHAERLSYYTEKITQKLKLSPIECHDLNLLCLLHDVGKIGIDDSVLKKTEPLTENDWKEMRRHSEIGYRIAMSTPETASIAEYILYHHERWDGTGYPRGLAGEDIPLLSRILAVVDAFDAMTQDRVYRKAMTFDYAVEEIRLNASKQFDPDIARIFIGEIIQEEQRLSIIN